MSITPSAATGTEVAKKITEPGWLLLIGDSNRLSTFGSGEAMGVPWTGASFQVRGIGASGNLSAGADLVFDDVDGFFSAMLLTGGFKGQSASLWSAWRGALDVGDPILQIEGRVSDPRSDFERRTVSVRLLPATPRRLTCPRQFYGPSLGMATSMPAGAVLRIGRDTYTVKR